MASATNTRCPQATAPRMVFRTSLPSGAQQAVFNSTKAAVKDNQLHTVCEEARCPNIHECWASGDATFMIAGQECTRVPVLRRWHHQTPASSRPWRTRAPRSSGVLDEPPARGHHRREPRRPRRQWSRPLQTLHRCSGTNRPNVTLELLCSDLAGDLEALAHLLNESPLAVFAHNVECVPRLDATVRDARASFGQSLSISGRQSDCVPTSSQNRR